MSENDNDQAQFSTSAKIKVEGSSACETRFQLVVVPTFVKARTMILTCEEAFLCERDAGVVSLLWAEDMTKDVGFLKDKSKRFFSNALYLFERGDHDLCAFNLEQSCQLLVKYFIAKRVGEWPKTHYLDSLMRSLSEIYEKAEIYEYYLENELFFDDLSDAYFTSRYFPKAFTKNLTQKLIDEYRKFLNFLEVTLNEKLDFDK